MTTVKKMFFAQLRKHSYVFLIAIAISISLSGLSLADETTEDNEGILVESATISAAKQDEKAVLSFAVSNYTRDSLTLKYIASSVAQSVDISIAGENGNRESITDLTILQEETLNLASSHIRIEMSGLKREIRAGEEIEFELIFLNSRTFAIADVH